RDEVSDLNVDQLREAGVEGDFSGTGEATGDELHRVEAHVGEIGHPDQSGVHPAVAGAGAGDLDGLRVDSDDVVAAPNQVDQRRRELRGEGGDVRLTGAGVGFALGVGKAASGVGDGDDPGDAQEHAERRQERPEWTPL